MLRLETLSLCQFGVGQPFGPVTPGEDHFWGEYWIGFKSRALAVGD
jgi:hypothetical protein